MWQIGLSKGDSFRPKWSGLARVTAAAQVSNSKSATQPACPSNCKPPPHFYAQFFKNPCETRTQVKMLNFGAFVDQASSRNRMQDMRCRDAREPERGRHQPLLP